MQFALLRRIYHKSDRRGSACLLSTTYMNDSSATLDQDETGFEFKIPVNSKNIRPGALPLQFPHTAERASIALYPLTLR